MSKTSFITTLDRINNFISKHQVLSGIIIGSIGILFSYIFNTSFSDPSKEVTFIFEQLEVIIFTISALDILLCIIKFLENHVKKAWIVIAILILGVSGIIIIAWTINQYINTIPILLFALGIICCVALYYESTEKKPPLLLERNSSLIQLLFLFCSYSLIVSLLLFALLQLLGSEWIESSGINYSSLTYIVSLTTFGSFFGIIKLLDKMLESSLKGNTTSSVSIDFSDNYRNLQIIYFVLFFVLCASNLPYSEDSTQNVIGNATNNALLTIIAFYNIPKIKREKETQTDHSENLTKDQGAEQSNVKEFYNFSKCVNKLKSADFSFANEDAIYRMGVVTEFNRTFELAWKALQAVLRLHGAEGAETGSPREILQLGDRLGFIEDSTVWRLMLKKHNTSVHIYDEDKIDEMLLLIRDSFTPAFSALANTLREKMTEIDAERME